MSRSTRQWAMRTAGCVTLALVCLAVGPPRPTAAQMGPVAPQQPPPPRTLNLLGRVLGPDGQPIPGARVGVVDPTRGYAKLDGLLTTQCGEAGEFEVTTTDMSEWYGPQSAYCVLARSGDGALAGSAIVPASEAAQPVQVALQPAAYVHSSVLDPQAQPLAGIGTVVRIIGNIPGAIEGPLTNERGEVLIGPLPAGLQLSVGVAYEYRHLVAQNVWDRKDITLQPGETYELAPLTLDPKGRAVEGTLEDAEGKPLAGAQVACTEPQWPLNVATADDQGRFRLTHLPVKGHDVWLIAADTTEQLYVMSPVDPDSGQQVRLALRPLTEARGLLAGPDGQVLSGMSVRIFPTLKAQQGGVTAYTMWHTDWVPLPQPVKAAEDGSWRVSGLIAGAMYALQPEVPGGYLDLHDSLFGVDRDGKPTDCGLMMMQ